MTPPRGPQDRAAARKTLRADGMPIRVSRAVHGRLKELADTRSERAGRLVTFNEIIEDLLSRKRGQS